MALGLKRQVTGPQPRAASPDGALGQRNVTRTSPSATSPAVAPPSTIAAVDLPDVIPITDFRRNTARIIAAQVAAERHVLITQCGYVTAVVLSPKLYGGLVRRARRDPAAERGSAVERGVAAGRGMAASGRVNGRAADVADDEWQEGDAWPEDIFGFLDAETAEILESGGWELE